MPSEHEKSGLFDFTHWPIVIARMPKSDNVDFDRWTAGFDFVLSRGEPFVIILDLEEFLKDPRETPEQKKQGALWMKKNREDLKRHCKGNVYIIADDDARKAMLQDARKQGKSLGLNFEAGADLEEALQIARGLLG